MSMISAFMDRAAETAAEVVGEASDFFVERRPIFTPEGKIQHTSSAGVMRLGNIIRVAFGPELANQVEQETPAARTRTELGGLATAEDVQSPVLQSVPEIPNNVTQLRGSVATGAAMEPAAPEKMAA